MIAALALMIIGYALTYSGAQNLVLNGNGPSFFEAIGIGNIAPTGTRKDNPMPSGTGNRVANTAPSPTGGIWPFPGVGP